MVKLLLALLLSGSSQFYATEQGNLYVVQLNTKEHTVHALLYDYNKDGVVDMVECTSHEKIK